MKACESLASAGSIVRRYIKAVSLKNDFCVFSLLNL